jgi:excisionase family DNA binding protein
MLAQARLLRPIEAAQVLSISVRQLDRLVEQGVVRPLRLTPGGNRRFRAVDLLDLAARDSESEAKESER